MRSDYVLAPTNRPPRQPTRIERDIPTGDRLRERRDMLGPWASPNPAERLRPQVAPSVRETFAEEVDTPFGRTERRIEVDIEPARAATPPLPADEEGAWAPPTPPLSPSAPPSPPLSPGPGAAADEEVFWNNLPPIPPPPARGVVEIEDEVEVETTSSSVPTFSRRRLLNKPVPAARSTASTPARRPLAEPSAARPRPPARPQAAAPSAPPAAETLALSEYAGSLFELLRSSMSSGGVDAWREQLLPGLSAAAQADGPPAQATTRQHALRWEFAVDGAGDGAGLLHDHAEALLPTLERVAQEHGLVDRGEPLRLIVLSRAGVRSQLAQDERTRLEIAAHPRGRDERPTSHRLLARFAHFVARWLASFVEAVGYAPLRNQVRAVWPNVQRRGAQVQQLELTLAAYANLLDRTYTDFARTRHALAATAALGYAHDVRALKACGLLVDAMLDVLLERSVADAGTHRARPVWHAQAPSQVGRDAASGPALPSRAHVREALAPLSRDELRRVFATHASATHFVYGLS